MMERQNDFSKICSSCKIVCCRGARPPLTMDRMNVIREYLKNKGLPFDNVFDYDRYYFPKEKLDGRCIFLDENKMCTIQPVKPETCVAGPITFDMKLHKVEFYLKTEEICPLAGVLFKNKDMLREHFNVAKKEIITLVNGLRTRELLAILSIEESDTFKIDSTMLGV